MQLSQHQIITELKCLIARQQQCITKLIKQIQILKKQKQNLNRNGNQSLKLNNQSNIYQTQVINSIHIQNKHQENHKYEQSQGQNVKSLVKKIYQNVVLPLIEKYNNLLLGKTNTESNSFIKQKTNIPSPSKIKQASIKSLPDNSSVSSMLTNTKSLLSSLDSRINLFVLNESNLKKQVTELQRTLKQMILSYENNIKQSQTIENKLISQIQRLKNQGKSSRRNQFTGSLINNNSSIIRAQEKDWYKTAEEWISMDRT